MTSSALTGNTSGLASATSPGLVGITTQTFAGVKTFNSPPVISDASGIVAATASVSGVVTTAAQTIAGAKTFSAALTLYRQYFPANNDNGATTKGFSIRAISTDGGTNTASVFCNNRFGVNKWVGIAAFDASGNATTFASSVASGSTLVVIVTDAATNY
jgi:hypothetical protein